MAFYKEAPSSEAPNLLSDAEALWHMEEEPADYIFVENVLMMQYVLNAKLNSKIIFFDDESCLFINKHKLTIILSHTSQEKLTIFFICLINDTMTFLIFTYPGRKNFL